MGNYKKDCISFLGFIGLMEVFPQLEFGTDSKCAFLKSYQNPTDKLAVLYEEDLPTNLG